MSIWVNVSEVNNILGKALESCKDELSPLFYSGARLMLDKINEMAEETADTPQTERCYKEEDVVRVVENVKRGYGLTKTAEEIVADMQTETQTETQNSNLTFEQTDCGWK